MADGKFKLNIIEKPVEKLTLKNVTKQQAIDAINNHLNECLKDVPDDRHFYGVIMGFFFDLEKEYAE